MTKEEFIQNELAIKIANLELQNAQLKAELQEATQRLQQATNEVDE